jgi:hypothetical protein
VVITDPKQIKDPLSEALLQLASQVNVLKEKLRRLEEEGGRLPEPRQEEAETEFHI